MQTTDQQPPANYDQHIKKERFNIMKKQATFLAVLSTAVFTASMAFPAYAKAAGWTEDNGNWYYYDSYGDPLTDTWKKSGNDWYYLNSDGIRAYSQQVDEYYVNDEGKRVTYQWVSIENEDYWNEDDAPEFLYYYYGKDGKALTSTWASINGSWYYFNEDSIMETGSIQVDGYNYYLGEDGSRKTGWILLEEETDDPEDLEAWYYFDSNGRRVENEVDKKIDGAYYTFEDGKMQTGWYKLPAADKNPAEKLTENSGPENTDAESTETATGSNAEAAENNGSEETAASTASLPAISGYKYYDEDGKRASGWRTIEGVENISEDGEYFRFYFKNGTPYYGKEGLEIFTIESKKYAFNTAGEMQTGKQSVKTSEGVFANYYFDEEGVMKTGKQTIYDEDLGETQNWLFHAEGTKKGQGYHGIKDNTLYVNGLRQEADRDLRFAPMSLDGIRYLVNVNGTVQKAGSTSKSASKPELGSGYKDFKDENEVIWTVNTEGIIQ